MVAGAVAADAPVAGSGSAWLIDHLRGRFALVTFAPAISEDDARRLRDDHGCDVIAIIDPSRSAAAGGAPAPTIEVLEDRDGHAARRYDARAGTCYLVRPDQHICARWRAFDMASVVAAIDRATGCATAGAADSATAAG